MWRPGHAAIAMIASIATVSPQGNVALSVGGDRGLAPEIARDVVIATDLIEIRPASWAGRLVWAQNSRRRPKHFDVYLREGGGVEQRVNASGTEGVPGGLDDTTLAYYVFTDTDAKIRLYDLATQTHLSPPPGVNGPGVDWSPTISGSLLFYLHQSGIHDRLILFDLSAGSGVTIARDSRSRGFLQPGQVNGDWASFGRCSQREACEVYRHQISTGMTQRVANPNDRLHTAPSIASDGTVFFIRSGYGCGINARVAMWDGTGPPSQVAALPPGRDSAKTFVDSSAPGSTAVYYERLNCNRAESDIMMTPVP